MSTTTLDTRVPASAVVQAGDTRAHRSHGRWSDGVPVIPLKVRDAAPIGSGRMAGGRRRV